MRSRIPGRTLAWKGEGNMRAIAMSRRNLLAVGTCALAGASSISATARARSPATRGATNEEIVRRYYKAWEKKDWGPIDVLLSESFAFTSANNDDHISKSAFKTQCWESQIDFINHFELKRLMTQGDWAFVKYLCRTKNGKSFRNVEYLQFRGEKIVAIECYFGAPSSFPSAVSTG
jgi:ketosteroid isomerase-like protein